MASAKISTDLAVVPNGTAVMSPQVAKFENRYKSILKSTA